MEALPDRSRTCKDALGAADVRLLVVWSQVYYFFKYFWSITYKLYTYIALLPQPDEAIKIYIVYIFYCMRSPPETYNLD
jgi:hypothetical protein